MAGRKNQSMSPPADAGEPPSSTKMEAAVRKWIEGIVVKSPAAGSMDAWNGELFDAIPLTSLRLTFTGSGRALCSYRVHASVADGEGNWHLGAIATVIDDIGAAAIMSAVGEIKISVDFSISFFSRAKIGVRFFYFLSSVSLVWLFNLGVSILEQDEVEIEAKIVEDMGKLTAVLIEVRHKKTGQLVAIGRQWMSFTPAFHRSKM
ncbi:hypothetical protein IEQ34_020435 [Dendrobium chrysotoxum]|uniref:Thioesterase domain-containing protein n=1 Tax=Dendrobium chrysotoxum TaxID=161865 RepID=A0AAV7G210_DENCH|nr:hypothetical protein IEQ34_020435 [Dendrobium chrysotoxum]